MRYCARCDRYLDGCPHLERRQVKRSRQWVWIILLLAMALVGALGWWG